VIQLALQGLSCKTNCRTMRLLDMFGNLKTDRMLNDGPGLHAALAKLENTRKKPCHSCDTKSFFSTKTNLIDKMR